jgi:hypothetical protein
MNRTMITKILRSAALVGAVALAGVPAVTQAASTPAQNPVHITYQTTMQTLPLPSGPWTGSLQLTFQPDGIIQGWYHPSDDATAFIPVTGGRDGDSVWFDIGRNGTLHVTGTIRNDEITGGAIDQRSEQQFSFSAKV